MNEGPEGAHRGRRRAGSRTPPPQPAIQTPPPDSAVPTPRRAKSRRIRAQRESGEAGLRELVGSGPSQLGVSAALRGRDVNRPTEQDLAIAERETVIVRRNWRRPVEG